MRDSVGLLHSSQSPMSSPFSSLLKLPYSILETGLVTMGSALSTAQRVVETAMGQKKEQLKGAPVNGPADIDNAVSDFMNGVARIARYTPMSAADFARAWSDIFTAAKKSFSYIDLKDPRNVGLPAQMALSFGTLFVQ